MPNPSSSKKLLRRLSITLWGLALLMGILVFTFRSKMIRQAPQIHLTEAAPLMEIADAPAFSLTNRDGSTVTLEDLKGKPWVADFVFTRCPGVCPIMTQRMKELIADMPEGSANYVSISVDPEYDTPEVLAEYAEKNGAGPSWYFLTGAKDEIFPLIRKGFMLALQEVAPEDLQGQENAEPIVHSNRFVLVDAKGKIRGYYNSFDADELGRLRTDLGRLSR